MIYVHFANTDGVVFTPDSSPIEPKPLGTVLRNGQHIMIVDRDSNDSISRIEASVLVTNLLGLLNNNGTENRRPRYVCDAKPESDDLFSQQSAKPSQPSDTVALKSSGSEPSITMYLPRMAYDMYGEAVIQREFYRNIPNIVIVTV